MERRESDFHGLPVVEKDKVSRAVRVFNERINRMGIRETTKPVADPADTTPSLRSTVQSNHREDRMKMSSRDAYEFIRTCLSHETAEARKERMCSFLEAGIDWELVLREATRHRVILLFFQTLKELRGTAIPSSVRTRLEEHQRSVRILNTFLVQELGNVVQHFREREIPLLTLKGPLLSKTAYGDISMRRSVDADIVIPRNQFSEAMRLLRQIGYEPIAKRKQIDGWRKKLSLYLDGQWEFTRGNAFTLDVHTRLMPPGYSFPAAFRPFWEQSQEIRLRNDVVVRGLSPEDRILVLAHHGMKNQWQSLRHVVDIAEVIRAEQALEWRFLRRRAQSMHATRVLKLALRLAHDLLDVMLPTGIERWSRNRSVEDVATLMKTHLRSRHKRSALSYGSRVQLQLLTKDTIGDQVRYGAHSLLQHLWSKFLRP